jgi:hypothetical protein
MMFKNMGFLKPGTSFFIGAGIVALAPVVLPTLRSVSKPVVKASIRSGLQTYHRLKATSIATKEYMWDLYEEAQSELSEYEK